MIAGCGPAGNAGGRVRADARLVCGAQLCPGA